MVISFVLFKPTDTLSPPLSPSSSGLGRRPFTALTRVQIPLGTQSGLRLISVHFKAGPVAQLVSAPPCHGGGRGFKSRLGRDLFLIFLVFTSADFVEVKDTKGDKNKFDWLGSSVGTSERLKIVRSPVRSRPKPQSVDEFLKGY